MKRMTLMAFGLLVATNLAVAQNKHPADIAQIDAALRTAKLTSAQRAEVIKLRTEGARMHYSGNHGGAEVALEKAKRLLKI